MQFAFRVRLFRMGRRSRLLPVMVAALLLVALVLPSALRAPVAHAQTVLATVAGVPGPVAVAYDSSKGEIFVANYEEDTVSVISDANNSVVAKVPVGVDPFAVAY